MITREEDWEVFGAPIQKSMRLFQVYDHLKGMILEPGLCDFIGFILSVWEQKQLQAKLVALAILLAYISEY